MEDIENTERKRWEKKDSKKNVEPIDKAQIIRDSKMPEEQKLNSLKKIGAIPDKGEEGITFGVYAKVRKINASRHKAMMAYPKAKDIRLATLQEWDEIFKDF
jgi:hypothetical protein